MAHLIQDYNPQNYKTPNNRNLIESEYEFSHMGLLCHTNPDILSHKSFTPTQFNKLFTEQEEEVQKELKVYASYKIYRSPIIKDTVQQYKNLFFYK